MIPEVFVSTWLDQFCVFLPFSLQTSLVVLRWLNVAEQRFVLFFIYIYGNFFLSSVYCMYIVLKSHQYCLLFVYLSKMVRICKTGSVMFCHLWRLYLFFLCKVSANDKHWLMYSMRLSAMWLVYRLRSKEKAIIPSVTVCLFIFVAEVQMWMLYALKRGM